MCARPPRLLCGGSHPSCAAKGAGAGKPQDIMDDCTSSSALPTTPTTSHASGVTFPAVPLSLIALMLLVIAVLLWRLLVAVHAGLVMLRAMQAELKAHSSEIQRQIRLHAGVLSSLAALSTAAPLPDTPPPARLLDLPSELLVRALSHCGLADIARVAAVSLLFHSSLAEEGIRLRAKERGFELPAQPEGESCAVRWLCYSALLRESNPPARAAGGWQHSVFIDGEGRLSSCGSAPNQRHLSHNPGPLGHGEGVTLLNTPTLLPSTLGGERAVSVSVSTGGGYSLALTADGGVWSWGYLKEGPWGHGDTESQLLPKKVEALAGQRVVAVSAGGVHSLAITADGAVWSWGWGERGSLGHGDQQRQLLPKKVEALAGQSIVAVSAGSDHSLALQQIGRASCRERV